MDKFFKPVEKSAVDALYEAQKIAFAPMVFQAARCLRDLGILKAIEDAGEVGLPTDTIARNLSIPENSVRVLLESGLSSGLLAVTDQNFSLTKTGYFLLNDPMTRANMDYAHHVCFQGLFFLDQAVNAAKPAGLRVFGDWETIYPALTKLPPTTRDSWFRFNHFYSDRAFPQALPLVFAQQTDRLLDVGGNTGRWAIACAQYSDQVEVTIVDLPEQLEVARVAIAETPLQHRVHCFELDLLCGSGALPRGHDVIWMSQFLDCFCPEDIVKLLKLAAAAMDENTRLYILEPFWDRQSLEAGAYCLINTSLYFVCMANGRSRIYHSRDMRDFVQQAGMSITAEWDGLGICHTLMECRKQAADPA